MLIPSLSFSLEKLGILAVLWDALREQESKPVCPQSLEE